MMDVTQQILIAGYLGFDPLDIAGRVIRMHPTPIAATRHAQPGSRIWYLQITLDQLLEAGALIEVVE